MPLLSCCCGCVLLLPQREYREMRERERQREKEHHLVSRSFERRTVTFGRKRRGICGYCIVEGGNCRSSLDWGAREPGWLLTYHANNQRLFFGDRDLFILGCIILILVMKAAGTSRFKLCSQKNMTEKESEQKKLFVEGKEINKSELLPMASEALWKRL